MCHTIDKEIIGNLSAKKFQRVAQFSILAVHIVTDKPGAVEFFECRTFSFPLRIRSKYLAVFPTFQISLQTIRS